MAHLRSSSYYQDSHDDYASSSSSYRQPYHDRSLHLPKTERRGRPAYTTVRPFIINSTGDHHRPVRRERDDHDEHHRRVGDYVADRLVPTMLRTSDRPVEVFMNFGDAKLTLPDDTNPASSRLGRHHMQRGSSSTPNAIIYNAPGCSLTLDGRRCSRYCDKCDLLNRDQHNRDCHHVHNHDHHRELDLGLDRTHHDRHHRSRSHIRVVSHSRNPSPSPLPLPGLFPIATAVENATRSTHSQHRRVSHALCPGCLIKTTVYRDGYCADCDPPRYSTSSSRRVNPSPVVREQGHGTRVRYTRDVIGDGSSSEDGWARVDVASRDPGRYRAKSRGRDRERGYDVITDGGGYGGLRRGRSRWEKERRLTPRYSGYASESDL